MVESMLRARNGQPAVEDEGPAGDVDQRADPKEEAKDADHVLEVRRREEGLTRRMQTRHSQKGNHSNIYHDMPVATIDDDLFQLMKKEDRDMIQ